MKTILQFFSSLERDRRNRALLYCAFIGIALLRLYFCSRVTINTDDAIRHICWGLIVNEHGYGAVNQSISAFSPNLAFVSWNGFPFNYPILSLLFDQLCALFFPSLFMMKLLLTGIEMINSGLVLKYTKSPMLSLAYWASPISIWWVSHEGQFEPLQNMLVLLALLLFARGATRIRDLAWLVLALAVQVKLTAVFLVPFFVLSEFRLLPLLRRGCFFAAGFLPTLLLFLVANPLELLTRSAALRYNPYYYNFFDKSMFLWNPGWLLTSNQAATYGLLLLLIGYGLYRRTLLCWAEVLPAILLLIFIKLLPNGQFWYMITLLPFLLTISNTGLRNALVLASPLLDIRSTIQLLFGPFGWTMPTYYQHFKQGAFTNLRSFF